MFINHIKDLFPYDLYICILNIEIVILVENQVGKSILIVEDDNVSRTLYKEMLKISGVSLHFAKTGKETLEFFENNPVPDILFLDIRLPDINGLDITKQLLSRYPDLVIIAQTAFAQQQWEKACMEVGMKAFITKPIIRANLEPILQKYL